MEDGFVPPWLVGTQGRHGWCLHMAAMVGVPTNHTTDPFNRHGFSQGGCPNYNL